MSDNLKKGEDAAGKVSIVTFLLAAGKGIAGVMTGSIALLTDALHSTVDLVVAVASWLSLKLSQREADEQFQYGYYKAENLAAFVISFFILYAAFNFAIEGIKRLSVVEPIKLPFLAMGATLVSAIVSGYLVKYLREKGEETGSASLLANAKETLADVMSSLVVFVAIVCTYLEIPYVEGVVTIGISLFIFKEGFETIKDSSFALMDVSPSKKLEKEVAEAAKKVNGVKEVNNLKLRKSGPFILGDLDVQISKSADVERAHTVADEIEEKAKRNVKELESIAVQVEPFKPKERTVAIPVKEDKGMKSEVSNHLGRCEHIVFLNITPEEKTIEKIMKNEYKQKKVRAGLSLSRELCEQKTDAVVVQRIGEISFHTLRDCFTDIYKTEGKTVEEVSKKVRKNQLKLLKEPTKRSGAKK